MKRAKSNVELDYAVVGIQANLQMSFEVMEKVLPGFFSGAAEIYVRMAAAKDPDADGFEYKRNVNPLKKMPSEEAVKVLIRNLTYEIDFYNFATQRILNQYRLINNHK